jgi:hypothetical protein
MTFGTWNVRSFYKAGSLKAVRSKLAKYNFDLVAVRQVRRVESGSQPADDHTFFYVNGNASHHLGRGFFAHKGIISAVKRVEFIRDRKSYKTPRGRWCDIIVLNVHQLRIKVMI